MPHRDRDTLQIVYSASAAALVEVEPGGMREVHWHPRKCYSKPPLCKFHIQDCDAYEHDIGLHYIPLSALMLAKKSIKEAMQMMPAFLLRYKKLIYTPKG